MRLVSSSITFGFKKKTGVLSLPDTFRVIPGPFLWWRQTPTHRVPEKIYPKPGLSETKSIRNPATAQLIGSSRHRDNVSTCNDFCLPRARKNKTPSPVWLISNTAATLHVAHVRVWPRAYGYVPDPGVILFSIAIGDFPHMSLFFALTDG